ncbi:MAG: YtoQ family protein, partial [Bacteroidota bacterium]
SAKINTIRNKIGLEEADLVIVRFGDKYRQWNAAFDAGYAAALGTPYVVIHPQDFDHALKELDAQALAVARENRQVIEILSYVCREYH